MTRRALAWLGVSSLLAVGCGGKSRTENGVSLASGGAGSSGAAATASATGAGGAPERCAEGDARCSEQGMRERCGPDGNWSMTDFVCARSIAVDDEVGSYCVTKADGSYRCWGGEESDNLPDEPYRRVQRTRVGLVGLTEDGQLRTPSHVVLPALSPVADFRATNMFGGWGICPLLDDGSFQMLIESRELDAAGSTEVRPVEGHFKQAFCSFEGLAAGVRTGGSLWARVDEVPEGSDFVEVALSLSIFCATTGAGEVRCFAPRYWPEPAGSTDTGTLPTFPSGRYHSLAATYSAVCAIDERGSLVCRRYDGVAMPVDDGRYRLADAGKNVLCAVRVDGSSACFAHGDSFGSGAGVGDFVPLPRDPNW